MIAQALGNQPDSTLSYLIVGIVVLALVQVMQLAVSAKQLFGGNKGERQIEPTQLHAISNELGSQTKVLSDINREVGEVKTKVDIVKDEVAGFHQRVGGISRELAATTARVDGLEKRETT